MFLDNVLHFFGAYVLAVLKDYGVLLAAHQEDAALAVDAGAVAGVEESVLSEHCCGCLRVFVISFGHALALNA